MKPLNFNPSVDYPRETASTSFLPATGGMRHAEANCTSIAAHATSRVRRAHHGAHGAPYRPTAEFRLSYPLLSLQNLTAMTVAIALFACISTANADNLGRLFFTPAQRAQLDYSHARNAPTQGNTSPFLTVDGIVQKQNGARTVWINGVAQSAGSGSERSPTAQTITVPGKSRPVKIKVGEKILLDRPVAANQEASGQ
jgi:hypothetical protein